MLDTVQYVSGLASGMLVGLSLGLVGGGGSILAVPLMVYLVGVPSPHVAIGTSAFAVAANAALGLFHHARHSNVAWRYGGIFALAGVLGALLGSFAGKAVAGHHLLFLFALLMLVVAAMMSRHREEGKGTQAEDRHANTPKVLGFGAGTGLLSGFFGIGGGFLIVPALVAATGMPMYRAIGTSLVAVIAFGIATAASYAFSGYVEWMLALVFIIGGFFGTLAGTQFSARLADNGWLKKVFVGLIVIVAFYMMWHSLVLSGVL